MTIATKSILLICDEPERIQSVTTLLKDKVRLLISATSDREALQKATVQEFDCILLRTKNPFATVPNGFFAWCKTNKQYVKVPWLILGRDIEAANVLLESEGVKFLDDPNNGASILQMLEGLFFTPTPSGSGTVDVNFINPIVAAVINVLKTMGHVDLVRGTPFLRVRNSTETVARDVSGIIAMNSNRFLGSIAFCYTQPLIFKIYEAMFGTPPTQINDDVKDTVAELTNIIFGHSKRDLNAVGHTITPAIPVVISGANHEITHSVEGTCIGIPFTSSAGSLLVECVISPPKK